MIGGVRDTRFILVSPKSTTSRRGYDDLDVGTVIVVVLLLLLEANMRLPARLRDIYPIVCTLLPVRRQSCIATVTNPRGSSSDSQLLPMSDANLGGGGGVNNCIDSMQIVFRLNYVSNLQVPYIWVLPASPMIPCPGMPRKAGMNSWGMLGIAMLPNVRREYCL